MSAGDGKKGGSTAQDRLDHIEDAQDVIDKSREQLDELDASKRKRDADAEDQA